MAAAGQAVAVDLEPVTQAGLHDALTRLDLADEQGEVGHQVRVEATDMGRDYAPEQEAAEAGGRLDRQREMTERDATRRRNRTRMLDLELGQQHAKPGAARARAVAPLMS